MFLIEVKGRPVGDVLSKDVVKLVEHSYTLSPNVLLVIAPSIAINHR